MPGGIFEQTAARPERNGEPVDDLGELGSNGQSRGASSSRRQRTRRAKPGGKISGRKFQVPDSVFERLTLHAIKKSTNASAVLTDILDRELPKHRIATDE